jgi:hypothetical protein
MFPMKRWSSVVLALALLAVPPFVTAKPDSHRQVTVSEAACCCCSPGRKHTGTVTCKCDGCAQKEAQRCDCVSTSLSPALLPAGAAPDFSLSLSGRISIPDTRYVERTDPPLLRPPIFS